MYTFRGSNCAVFYFSFLINGSQLLKEKNLLPQEQILSFQSRIPFGRPFVAHGSTQEVTEDYLCKTGGKNLH